MPKLYTKPCHQDVIFLGLKDLDSRGYEDLDSRGYEDLDSRAFKLPTFKSS